MLDGVKQAWGMVCRRRAYAFALSSNMAFTCICLPTYLPTYLSGAQDVSPSHLISSSHIEATISSAFHAASEIPTSSNQPSPSPSSPPSPPSSPPCSATRRHLTCATRCGTNGKERHGAKIAYIRTCIFELKSARLAFVPGFMDRTDLSSDHGCKRGLTHFACDMGMGADMGLQPPHRSSSASSFRPATIIRSISPFENG